MTSQPAIITVFGGTGFLGRHAIRSLARTGATIRIATRAPKKAYFLRPCGTVGQIVPVHCDITDDDSVASVLAGATHAVNLVGILNEKGRRDTFQNIHAEVPKRIARLAKKAGVTRLVHVSALGASAKAPSRYLQSKAEGEKNLLKTFPEATILRPGLVFGPEDRFFNLFARLARCLPVIPLPAMGQTKFQPVHVGDVAAAIERALFIPQGSPQDPRGQCYELAGPSVYSFRDLVERTLSLTGRKRRILPLSSGISRLQATVFELMPGTPLVTRDQLASLTQDNIAGAKSKGLKDLGIRPTALELVLPGILAPWRKGGSRTPAKQRA